MILVGHFMPNIPCYYKSVAYIRGKIMVGFQWRTYSDCGTIVGSLRYTGCRKVTIQSYKLVSCKTV